MIHLSKIYESFRRCVTVLIAPSTCGTSGTRFTADHKGILYIFTPKHHLWSPAHICEGLLRLRQLVLSTTQGVSLCTVSQFLGVRVHTSSSLFSHNEEIFSNPARQWALLITASSNDCGPQRIWLWTEVSTLNWSHEFLVFACIVQAFLNMQKAGYFCWVTDWSSHIRLQICFQGLYKRWNLVNFWWNVVLIWVRVGSGQW